MNYSGDQKWWERVLQKTNGKGVNLVFDPVGRAHLSLGFDRRRSNLAGWIRVRGRKSGELGYEQGVSRAGMDHLTLV